MHLPTASMSVLILDCVAWIDDQPLRRRDNRDRLRSGWTQLSRRSLQRGASPGSRLDRWVGEIRFPTSAKSEETQAFVEQGIAQLHGFWFLEAERSFRQAAKLEPELAIAYWGMAMANNNNVQRARGLIDESMKLRDKNTSRREKLYIEAFDRFFAEYKNDKAKTGTEDAKEATAKTQNEIELYG